MVETAVDQGVLSCSISALLEKTHTQFLECPLSSSVVTVPKFSSTVGYGRFFGGNLCF